MDYAFQARDLVKTFGKTEALKGLDLAAPPGTVLGVLGPNGAGKTTAVRILATLLRPDSGSATVGGFDVLRHAAKVRRLIGLTGQYASVDEELTGTENLVLVGQLLDLRKSEAVTRAAQLLEEFGLSEAAGRRAGTYSGGMRRRLDLAASLVGHPSVIYLDEPTAGLDPAVRDEVWRRVRSLADEGVAVLLTTQYLEEADALADNVIVIDHGKVIAEGTPAELKQRVGGQRIVVRPNDSQQLGEVSEIIAAVTRSAPEPADRGVLTVPVESGGAFTEVVRRLDEACIEPAEIALRLPSLDEVFVALTGHHATKEAA